MEKKEKVKAQAVVHNQLYSEIHSFVSRRVNNKEDVDDLVQDIFEKFQKNESKIRDQELLVPWLYRVARNQIIDFYRKKGLNPPRLVDEMEINENNVFQEVASWLVFFIGAMSEQDQQILELTEMKAKTQKEAAEMLGINLDAAKARHQRAKKRLKESLEKCCAYMVDSRGHIIDYEVNKSDDCCD